MNSSPVSPASGPAWARAIARPELCSAWSEADWERAVRLSRRLRLLGRLAESIDAAGLMAQVPAPAVPHLLAEQRYSRWRIASLRWVLDRLGAMLAGTDYPKVLLKGAAYVGQGLPIARGRLPSDADILVPRAFIEDAQQRLRHTGWVETPLDDHDRRYYHEWSHEVPPMRHAALDFEVDLHHNILPPVARTPVDADRLLGRLQDSQWPQWKVLAPVDQVLHCAAHLFYDSDVRDRLRDVVDLDGLMRHFGPAPGFWDELPERARELGLAEPLALAAHFGVQWLQTPVPGAALERLRRLGPGRWRAAWLQALLTPLLTPTDPDAGAPFGQSVAARVFLARHHLWRLPVRLLIPHLWHKARAHRGRDGAEAAEPLADPR